VRVTVGVAHEVGEGDTVVVSCGGDTEEVVVRVGSPTVTVGVKLEVALATGELEGVDERVTATVVVAEMVEPLMWEGVEVVENVVQLAVPVTVEELERVMPPPREREAVGVKVDVTDSVAEMAERVVLDTVAVRGGERLTKGGVIVPEKEVDVEEVEVGVKMVDFEEEEEGERDLVCALEAVLEGLGVGD